MPHKNELEKNSAPSKKPEEIAMKQLKIENLKKKIEELNKILEQFSRNNSKNE